MMFLLVSYVLDEQIVLIWRGIPGIMTLHNASVGGQFWASLLHRQVTSRHRLLPTPSGTSNSHVVPVRFRATARVLMLTRLLLCSVPWDTRRLAR